MKVAVATTDGIKLSAHFGRSAGFVVFEIEDDTIKRHELRANHHTPHAVGQCSGDQGEHRSHDHASHDHSSIVSLLRDCDVVLCGGMGPGALNALKDSGIRALILPKLCSVTEAVRDFQSGLVPTVSSPCDRHSVLPK